MNKKKIVMVHTDFRIYWPFRIDHFFNLLDKSKYDLSVIEISGHGGNYNFENREIIPPYWECLYPDKNIKELDTKEISLRLLQRLQNLKPEILIAGAIAFPSGAIAVRYANQANIPLIIFDDARLEDVKRNFLVNWIKKQLYSGVDAIFCPATAWDETFEFFGFHKEQIFYGVDVVDNDFFDKIDETVNDYSFLGKNYFLNIGRQIEKKNLVNLIQAYKALSLRKNNIPNLVFVGEGDKRTELENYVKNHNLSNVIFLPYLPQKKLKSIYQNASLFILPSSYGETWGLVINEAMASGLPVIVSNKVGCSSTLVKEGVNGFIFDSESLCDFESKIERFLNLNLIEKQKMSASSREIINDWGLDKFSNNLYKAVLFCQSQEKTKISFIGKLISSYWKGNYNSV